ncbi:hypothetical protein HS088_TW13G01435 [Tripterygium wilfordii]|uniref:Uncharacterized protein n=1 Tax=Tripterygium wilfordii TaxID=458696 RepID=A0A7J7CWP1_TRIWF|nr:uncharacterized protein LOC120013584 isoform X1 [Tripterygium wilfordii]KAF5738535.1 hypothetical protein HS088_TW13G01435 [Tripterygium wilfordii]
MGSCGSKCTSEEYNKVVVRGLREKIRLLQGEIKGIMIEREREIRAYEGDTLVFAFKEAEWKQEKKRLKGEIKTLKKVLEEKEDKIREIEVVGERSNKESDGVEDDDQCQWQLQLEQMREERVWRDEAVEKWKQLYLAIKTELDDLLQRTHIHHGAFLGDRLHWSGEEEEMKRELKAKEAAVEALKARLASMEKEEYKRAREVDILRQSLRIVSHKKISQLPAKLYMC